MKTTGIVRKVDELGRITLPIELRRTLGVNERDPMEIFVDEDKIVLRKYEEEKEEKVCKCCGSKNNLKKNKKVYICESCLIGFKEIV